MKISHYLKASKMIDVGRSMILSKMLGKSHSVFKVESQSDSSKHVLVKIVHKSGLSRDIMSQFQVSCSCIHFQRSDVKFCKHVIYCLRCFYVRD